MSMSISFDIVAATKAAPIYISTSGYDAEGLQLVARSFVQDVELIAGIPSQIVTTIPSDEHDTLIIAGTIGHHPIIDQFIAEGKLSTLHNKRESYVIQVLEQPFAHIKRALVIAGSDKRGTFYGIYHISRLMGVSPWVYWGDVVPEQRAEISITLEQNPFISNEPSITYRGFFLNDEWPSLGTWTTTKFGDFNEGMYQPIFELLLRLNANFMWPAMWSAVFSENGKKHPQAIAEMANAYGIVMGTSHHEPMFRAGEEWQNSYEQYSTFNVWDFDLNREGITRFWEDGVIRNKHYESIVTLGMRGERDSELGGTLEQNVNRLKDIITTQKQILKKHGLEHAPKALVVYKEVEKFWHGSEEVVGLKHWDELNDVIIILSDDNFGNMRTLPEPSTREREAGWGIYYHFDYHGGPNSYEWVNTTPLEKVWEQMTMAHEYGIRDLWVVNVGDLKPNEFPISYYIDLATHYDRLGIDYPNITDRYTFNWVKEQFGYALPAEYIQGIADLLTSYTQLNGQRKPEVVYPHTYSITAYNEAERMLQWCDDIELQSQFYRKVVPTQLLDAYDQLVHYPAAASANVTKMNIYAAYYEYYRSGKYPSQLANKYVALVEETIQRDIELQRYYNEDMSGGKWYGMMLSPHVGYVKWNSEGWSYPKVQLVQATSKEAQMIVHVQGQQEGLMAGKATLPTAHQLQPQNSTIMLSNKGAEAYTYEVTSSDDWLRCYPTSGQVIISDQLTVEVDYNKLEALRNESNTNASLQHKGTLMIKALEQLVEVEITAILTTTEQLPADTYIAFDGVVTMSAEQTSLRVAAKNGYWQQLDGYGKFDASIKHYPSTCYYVSPEEAPYVEYSFYVNESAQYELTVYMAPTNPLYPESRLRYAVAIDQQAPVVITTLSDPFTPGESKDWEQGVLNNGHTARSTHTIEAGVHTLRFYNLDAGIVLQKLVLSRHQLPYSFLGPEESYFKRS